MVGSENEAVFMIMYCREPTQRMAVVAESRLEVPFHDLELELLLTFA